MSDHFSAMPPVMPPAMPGFREAFMVWLRIGCLSFGGPAGQIALLHREVVDERRWISDRRFLGALNFCTLLPGPEAQQLATYLGWLMHGPLGGLAAGLLFVIPGALVMLALSLIYLTWGAVPLVAAVFLGLKSAVLVLVLQALLRVGRRALKGVVAWAVAWAAFVGLFLFAVPFPVVILTAAAIGALLPSDFTASSHGRAQDGPMAAVDAAIAADPTRALRHAASARRAGLIALALWVLPVAVLMPVGGAFADISWFFSRLAVVTFGGAYAVLAYAAQEAVQRYHWLSAAEMLTGLGLAETTPGPLILVLQFVGFLAGARAEGGLSGISGGIAASVLTLWVTFAPCFTFVFLGAPLIEKLSGQRLLGAALSGVTAAVVGVIGNLAVWFALHSLFAESRLWQFGPIHLDLPLGASLQPQGLALAILAGVMLLWLRRGVLTTLAVTAAAGVGLHLLAG